MFFKLVKVTLAMFLIIHQISKSEATSNLEKVKNGTKSVNGTLSKADFGDRINLVNTYGHAHATNEEGSSESDTFSYGYLVGLTGPGGFSQKLAAQSGSKSNSFASGKKPPKTFANGEVDSSSTKISGSSDAGYDGGEGNAFSNSHSDHIEVPLGIEGLVLNSNLHRVNESTSTTAPTSASTTTNGRFIFA